MSGQTDNTATAVLWTNFNTISTNIPLANGNWTAGIASSGIRSQSLMSFQATDSAGNNRYYTALSAVFHSQSEHTILGNRFDLEMQIVCEETHASIVTNPDLANRKGVFVLLFNKGLSSPLFAQIDFTKINSTTNIDLNLYNSLYPMFTEANSSGVINYFTYSGTTTNPNAGCKEGVDYYIINSIFSISESQLSPYTHLYGTNKYRAI